MEGFIRSASLTNFADVASRAGLHPERLLKEVGLPRRALTEPDLMVPIDSVRQLLETAAERSGLEAFGLLMAEARKLSNLGPVGLLMREQPTLRAAVETYVQYARALNQALFVTIEESADAIVLREELIVGPGSPVRQSTELAIGVLFQMLRAFLGHHWRPRRICFAHHAPSSLSVHHRLFGRRVEFGQVFNGIVCARRDLEVANPAADPQMARYAKTQLQGISSAAASSVTGHVRHFVVMHLGSGRCTVEQVAAQLRIDRRTLHRRLASEGQTFAAIVESVRRELAARYVAERKRPLSEISGLLGFSALSGFSRWYRRAFNQSASAARGRLVRTP
jgi:AraC-like DNA-binding protein